MKKIAINQKFNISKILTTLEWVMFLGLMVFLFVLLSPILPTKNFFTTYIVPTGSMEPYIKTGSVVLVKNIPTKDLATGDVISFVSPENPKNTIIHRISSIEKDENQTILKTKGDNNNSTDPWKVSPALIKGKLVFIIPYLGSIALFVKTPWGFFIIIGIPTIILISMQIKKIRDGIEEEIEKRTKQAISNYMKTHISTLKE